MKWNGNISYGKYSQLSERTLLGRILHNLYFIPYVETDYEE
jgi:hypothetical protein